MLKNKKSDYLFSAFPLCIISLYFSISSVLIICKVDIAAAAAAAFDDEKAWDSKVGPFVPRDQRRSLVSTEYGEISAAKVTDGINGSYYLQFIKLEPNALFLPVILHADMVFYVQTGSGRVGLINEDGGEENGKKKGDKAGTQGVDIQRGDVYRLPSGTVFFIQSSLEPERQKLRICAIFANSEKDLREPVIGPYSSIRDLVLGFDKKVLQAAFQVPEEVVEEMTSSKKPLAIVRGVSKSSTTLWEVEAQFVEALFGRKNYNMFDVNKKKGKSHGYNILTGDRDVHNCNGWSSTVTGKQLRSLRGSSIGIFMVNLTKGAMMGPHWNPMATEIAVVLEGRGMVHVVCPSTASETECKNKRIRAKEGDVFVVPRFHPMAQMSFNNGSFVFVGYTTTDRNNHPQFLAGKSSVLQTLDKQVLAESFNVSNSTVGQLLAPQRESIILECVSCAEEEEKLLEEEIEKEKEKARKKEEEEARKREEEKRKQEEEEARKREEEKKKEEEEAKEEKKRKGQEEARKREEEEKKRKEQEAAARKREEEEEARKEEEEEARRKEEQAQAEEARREAEKARKREEEEAKQREEEAQEEEARRREEQAQQEEKRRQEAAKEEEARRKERQQQEDERRRKEASTEEAAARRQEEEKEKQQQEEEGGPDRQKEKEREKQQQEGGGGTEAEQKEARQQEEEAQREEETRRQAAVKEAAARKKKEEEARWSKEEAQEEERGSKATAREKAARRQEEERGGGKHKQRKEKGWEKQQQKGGAGSRGQETTEAGQQEAQFWPGGLEIGE